MVRGYPELFTGLGEIPGEFQIELIENLEPFTLHIPRNVPLPLLIKIKEEIEKIIQMGVISRADEPIPWWSPMVVTPKPKGDMLILLSWIKTFVRKHTPSLLWILL